MKRRMADDPHAHVARARRLRRSLVLGGLILAAVVSPRWVRVNLSPSVPRGLYRLAPVPQPLTQGMLVVLPVPASVRPWHASWVPLLKPIAGLPGDGVCQRAHVLLVKGAFYGLVYPSARGLPLPQYIEGEGCASVPDGMVFLASATTKSLDSRYFGPVSVNTLTAQAIPVLTWR